MVHKSPEQNRTYQAAYRAAHRKERHAYNVAHREENRTYQADYRITHREDRLAHQATYRATHREALAGSSARRRCTNPNDPSYHNYGGRGIEWRFKSITAFVEHIGARPTDQHTLDRICVNWHYEPGNVQWVTRKEQARNRRNKDDTCKCHGKTLNQLTIERL